MEMPEHVKQELYEAEGLIKQIYANHMESARKETEPLIKMITSIKSMYPQPFWIPIEQLAPGILTEAPTVSNEKRK